VGDSVEWFHRASRLLCYCVWAKNDNFSYIGSISSTSNLDLVVASFGSHKVQILKEGFYSDHLPISTCFYSTPRMAQITESGMFSYQDWKMCQSSPSVKSVTRC